MTTTPEFLPRKSLDRGAQQAMTTTSHNQRTVWAAVFEPTSLCLACIHLPLSPLYQAVAWMTMGCPVGTRGFQSFGSMESCRTLWEVYSAGQMKCQAWIMLGPIPPECRQHDLKTKILKWTKGWNYWVHIRWTQWGPISLKDWLFLCEKKKKKPNRGLPWWLRR